MAADWAELPHDMLACIVKKLSLIDDFVAFRSVCQSWESAANNNKQYLRPQLPWLMFDETKENRKIYSFSKQDMILTKNIYVPEMHYKKCFGLNYGWVLTVSEGELNLFHPLSRHQKYIFDWVFSTSVSCAALSANPSESSDFVLMIVHGEAHLGYWRSREKRWTMVTNQWTMIRTPHLNGTRYRTLMMIINSKPRISYSDLTYYRDKFYAIEYNGIVWGCKVMSGINCNDRTLVSIIEPSFNKAYIVESDGDLLVVVRRKHYDSEFVFQVYKLDLINGGYKRIWNLGDRALFVGHNTSISLDVSEFPGAFVKANHIYFTYDRVDGYKGGDISSYNLKDGKCTQLQVNECRIHPPFWTRIHPPFWFIPSL